MQLVTIPLEGLPGAKEQQRAWCAQLEAGDILYFPHSPIAVPQEDLEFLLGRRQSSSATHKNIAYKPSRRQISGLDGATDAPARQRLAAIMDNYSNAVTNFLGVFLSPYRRRWRVDYASFRPQEEESRHLPTRKRNDLLHTDAFPTRPTYGARILRFFNNINPSTPRNWTTTATFPELAAQFAPRDIQLPQQHSAAGEAMRRLATAAGVTRLLPALRRSPYDDFMMRFHNFLKENADFQRDCPKQHWQFPPGSSWMVYTDTVSHAVTSGQYALEQTLLVAPEAMVRPEVSPLGVLQKMTGARLV